ncbi:MAG: hypothetical protein JSW07_08780 [bacterium]|nr:MAG: hypothetical protein JSW07_08780 [bacterium]
MSHALGNEVIEFTTEFEKFTADIQFLVDEVKEDVQKTLDEFREVQSSQTETIRTIEATIQNEVNNLKDLFRDIEQKFELFKHETSTVIEQSLASGNIDSDQLNQLLEAHGWRLDEMEQLQGKLSQFSNISPEKLRDELISGIRILGDRVSKAIEDIHERIDNFTNEIQTKISTSNEDAYSGEGESSDQENEEFASLKEFKLLDVNDYEIVPRKAIKKLTDLFKKQSSGVKNIIEKHEQRIQEFERLLKTYDEENTHLLELLDRRVKRNFLISMVAVIVVILCSIVMRMF